LVTEAKPIRKVTLNPFQMPEIPEEFLPPKEDLKPVESAAPIRQLERPKVRLLGFSNVDGLKALVELKGDVLAVEAGDVIEGVQIVSVQAPNVTFQFANSIWSTKLFDQPWFNQQTGLASTPTAPRALATQSHSTSRTNTRNPVPASRGTAGLNILGAAIPRIIESSTTPAVPGIPSADGSSGVPGAGSIPGMPSSGAPPASGMPNIPGSPGVPAGPGAIPGGGALPGGIGALPGGTGGLPGGIN
jgi:hypothetical protein